MTPGGVCHKCGVFCGAVPPCKAPGDWSERERVWTCYACTGRDVRGELPSERPPEAPPSRLRAGFDEQMASLGLGRRRPKPVRAAAAPTDPRGAEGAALSPEGEQNHA